LSLSAEHLGLVRIREAREVDEDVLGGAMGGRLDGARGAHEIAREVRVTATREAFRRLGDDDAGAEDRQRHSGRRARGIGERRFPLGRNRFLPTPPDRHERLERYGVAIGEREQLCSETPADRTRAADRRRARVELRAAGREVGDHRDEAGHDRAEKRRCRSAVGRRIGRS
jgi:hypothetical protein